MKRKYVFVLVAILAVLAVTYPVTWSYYFGTIDGNQPFSCPPLLPCDNSQPASLTCTTFCVIDIQNSQFVPATINVTKGATVEWVNLDSIAHTTDALYSKAWNSPVIPPGGNFTFTFSNLAPGTYYYQCNVHPFMTGQVNVLPVNAT